MDGMRVMTGAVIVGGSAGVVMMLLASHAALRYTAPYFRRGTIRLYDVLP